MRTKKVLVLFTLMLLLCSALFAQADDWYYGKPIKKVTFSGLKTITLTDVDGIATPFKGLLFTDEIWMDMLNRIYSLDYFDEIDVSIDPSDSSYSQIVIKFTVVEKPVVNSISFKGNSQIHSSELREAITLKKGDIFVGTKVVVDERKIRDAYLEKGFTNVKIASEYKTGTKGIDLTYTITEGTATVVTDICFEGNVLFTDKTLKGQLSMKESGIFNKGAFKESTLEQDRQKLALYYLDRGFVDSEITDVRRDITHNDSKNQDEMVLTYVIREGSQYTFGGLTISGNTIFSEKELMSLVTLKSGADFNVTKYQASLEAISDLYYENGYTSNRFFPQQERNQENRTITCSLQIVELPRSHIENIIIRGNGKTKDYVITREIPLEAGDIFNRTKLINGLRNLYNTQYFSAINPDVVQGSEENLVDLIIDVEEGQTHTMEFGVTFTGVTSVNEFPISVYIKNNNTNVGGEGKTISESLTISNTQQSVGFGFGNSWAFNKPVTFSASLDISHSQETALQSMYFGDGLNTTDTYMDYEKYSVEGSLALGRRWNPSFGILSVTGGISTDIVYNKFDSMLYHPVDTTILDNNGRVGMFNTVWASVSADDRDIYYDPSKGWFANQRLSYTGLLPEIESDYYLRSDTKLEGYLHLMELPVTDSFTFNMTLAGFTTLSTVTPFFGDELSHSNKLYIDGMFNGRGWNTIQGNRGHALWTNSLELRVPIVTGIVAADLWADAAVLKDSPKDLFTTTSLSDFYFSFGPGIRFSIQQFPIRLLFANTFRITDDMKFDWKDTGAFTLSFNIANR